MKVTFRDYQAQGVDLLNRSLNANRHPLYVAPTGSGKSIVIAGLLKLRNEPALVLSHVSELLEQNSLILKRVAPEISQTFFAAKLQQKSASGQVVFGSVQSVVRNLDRFKSQRNLLLIDEAHLCPRSDTAMYGQVFDYFSNARRAGFTATAMRLESGSLVKGDDAWFDHIASEVSIVELIDKGYLLPLVGIIAELQADLEGVHSRGGEYIESEAQAAVMRTLSLPAAVAQAVTFAKRRKSWLVFAAGVEHAKQIAEEFRAQGIDTEVVVGNTASTDRSDHLARFRARELRCVVNVGVLTTGFDAPYLDCIISMRPTQSLILWQQILGRGMRVAEGKQNCLLLDFVGNLERLGGAGAVSEMQDRRMPAAIQKAQERLFKAQRKARKDPEFFDASGRDPMLSGDLFEATVQDVRYFIAPSRSHPGKRLAVISYNLEDEFGRTFSARVFLCVEYTGGARYLATKWFSVRGIIPSEVPHDAPTAVALARTLPEPNEATVRYDARRHSYSVEQERFPLVLA